MGLGLVNPLGGKLLARPFIPGPLTGARVSQDSTAPTVSSASINSAGTSLTVVFSESVSNGSGGSGGWTVSPTVSGRSVTYASGSGSSTLVYTLGLAVWSYETITVNYTQPGNGVEDSAGNDLASFSGTAVTNNSTLTAINDITWDGVWQAGTNTFSTGTTPATNGQTVQNFADAVGGTKIITQATAADRPVYRSSVAALNNKPALQGDASSKFAQWDRGGTLAATYSVVIVGAFESGISSFKVLAGDYSGLQLWPWADRDTTSYESFYNNGTFIAKNLDSNAHMWVGVVSGSASKWVRDGLAQISLTGTTGLTGLTLFRKPTVSEWFSSGHVAFAAVYNGDLTANAKWENLLRWVASNYGIAAITGASIIHDSDSRSVGSGDNGTVFRKAAASFIGNQYGIVTGFLNQAAFTDPVSTSGESVNGRTMATQITDAATYVTPALAKTIAAKKIVVVINAASNDYSSDGNAAVTYAKIATYIAARQAEGALVLVGTVATYVGITVPDDALRTALNVLILANSGGANGTVDIAGDSISPQSNNQMNPNFFPGNFNLDGNHFSAAGNVYAGGLIETALGLSPFNVT